MSHLPLDELGDVDAVAGHPHLAECAQCRAVLDDQRAIRDLLAALPAPGRTPPDVVTRLDAAVDAALREAATPAATPLLGPRRPLRDARDLVQPSRRRRVATTAAKVLVGAAAAGLVVTGLGHLQVGGSADSAATTGAAGAGGSASSDSGAGPRPGAAERAASGLQRTGTRYTRAALGQQAARLVPVTPAGRDVPLSTGSGALSPSRDTASSTIAITLSCLRAAAVPGAVLAVDQAAFEGTPATVVVVSAAGRRRVWVLPRDCGRQPGVVLASATLP